MLVHQHDSDRGIDLKIPEFGIEMSGEDLPELIELAEEHLWWELKTGGRPVPKEATLSVLSVSKEEFGPMSYELDSEEGDWLDDEEEF